MEKLDDHYAKLLGLEEPWGIKDVDLRLEESKVEIALEHPVGRKVKCPECGIVYSAKEARLFGVFRSHRTVIALCLVFAAMVIGLMLYLGRSRL